MNYDKTRMPCLDAFKAFACLLIVLHHLSAYGPLSETAQPLIGGLLDWLYEYGRIAVQVFLVIAGFLSAKNLAPFGEPGVADPLGSLWRRYERLIVPYLAAITLAVLCAALARRWMDYEFIPGTPDFGQLLAHALLLHDLLNQEALSAGVWYVAIDFQLFALIAALLWASRKTGGNWAGYVAPTLIGLLTMASLFVFNRNDWWDETALYFFGSYGLGALSYWAATRRNALTWLAVLGAVVVLALLVDFRLRIAVAGVFMLLLGLARHYRLFENRPGLAPVTYLGQVSYSIFLVHFPLCLAVNALFFRFVPQQPGYALVGLGVALVVSIAGGILFYRQVESRIRCNFRRVPILAGFMASPLLASM